ITGTGLGFIPFIHQLKEWGDGLLASHHIETMPPLGCKEFERYFPPGTERKG
ncbi:MAG: hypothetical protein JST42_26620, partial [Bacteroidetes bacterium]|nr:hypothetical protein [Bacteroidota bacterium]